MTPFVRLRLLVQEHLPPELFHRADALFDEVALAHRRVSACSHPAACLRDGACGWCAAMQDDRLHIEEVARLASILKGIRAGLIIAGLPPVEDDCDVAPLVCAVAELEARIKAAGAERDALRAEWDRLAAALRTDHYRLAEMGESLLRVVAERAALAAHIGRLRTMMQPWWADALTVVAAGMDDEDGIAPPEDALDIVLSAGEPPFWTESAVQTTLREVVVLLRTLASTPAIFLEAHDRVVQSWGGPTDVPGVQERIEIIAATDEGLAAHTRPGSWIVTGDGREIRIDGVTLPEAFAAMAEITGLSLDSIGVRPIERGEP